MENGTHTTNGSNDALQATANGKLAINGGGRCPANGQVKTLTPKELTTRRTTCPGCEKPLVIKDNHFTEDFTGMTIPNHNLPKPETPEEIAPPPPPTVLRSPEGQVTQLSPPPVAPTVAIATSSSSLLFKAELHLDSEDAIHVYAIATNFAEATSKVVAFAVAKQGQVVSIAEVAGDVIV